MTKKDEYQARINARLETPENKMEGTLGQDVIAPVAYELARFEELEIDPLLDRAFARTAQGEDLDRVGDDEDIERKQAQSSIINVGIIGQTNATVLEGTQITFADVIFSAIESKTIENTSVLVQFQCETAGIVGNIPDGVVFEFIGSPYGLTSATSVDLIQEGVDTEDDEAYRERILDKKRKEASSGNVDDYIGWAKEVTGVDDVLVVPLEDGNGTVSVYISTADNTTPTQQLLDDTLNYIDQEKPIGATVTVNSVDYVDINITANVVLSDGGSASFVKEQFTALLDDYLKTTIDTRTVSYTKMADLLFNCQGVADVTSYTLNGANKSIVLTQLQIARTGEVVINA